MVCEFNCSPNFHERLVASVYLHSRAIQSLVFVPPSLIIRTETSCRTSPMSAQQGKILGFQTIKVLCSVDKLWTKFLAAQGCGVAWVSTCIVIYEKVVAFIYLFINFWYHSISFSCLFFFHNRQPVIASLFLGGKCCQFVTRVSEQYSKNRCMVNMTLAAVKVSFEERCHILDVESEINLFKQVYLALNVQTRRLLVNISWSVGLESRRFFTFNKLFTLK